MDTTPFCGLVGDAVEREKRRDLRARSEAPDLPSLARDPLLGGPTMDQQKRQPDDDEPKTRQAPSPGTSTGPGPAPVPGDGEPAPDDGQSERPAGEE